MSNTPKTKNDNAWERLFENLHILEHIEEKDRFVISSSTINEFREARLMTKFDHRNNLPTIFKENQLSVLPISRGEYVIARFDAYEKIDSNDNSQIEYVNFPDHIQSIDYENISSESFALNCAYISGILNHFLEDCTSSDFMGHIWVKTKRDFLLHTITNLLPRVDSICGAHASFFV